MRFRVKLYYMAVGYQVAGAFVCALMGKLSFALCSVVLAMLTWYGAEYWVNKDTSDSEGTE